MSASADAPPGPGCAPEASVIVIAHGRHDHLRRMLNALGDSEDRPREIVIVAMGDPAIARLPEVCAGRLGTVVRVVQLDADPGRLPLARARNAGAAAASGRHLIFLDVDCLADLGLVGRFTWALDRLAAAAAVDDDLADRGPVVCAGPVTYLPEAVPGGAPGAPLDWGLLRRHRDPHRARPDPAPGQLLRGDDLDLFWSLCFAVTREDYAACGGFDEAYEGYGGEDTDFARRLAAAGGSLWWVGGADAYHQHHPVSRPPFEHLHDILRNVALFRERWGQDCMAGWLTAFAERGLVERAPDGSWHATDPRAETSGRSPHPTRRGERPSDDGRTRAGAGRAGASAAVLHLVPGPQGHGVTRHALALLTAGEEAPVRLPDDPVTLDATLGALAPGIGVHLHLTDGLLADPVGLVTGLATRRRVSLTLHDIPTPAEGAARFARRAALYAELTTASCLVVVASAHERDLLARCLEQTASTCQASAEPTPTKPTPRKPTPTKPTPIHVVPLPIESPVGGTRPAPVPVVGVLGYLYPGKGHAEAIEAAAAAGLTGVVALGAVAEGHAGLADDLARAAEAAGLTWEVTGFLPDDELAERARRVAVPLAMHAHVSASGSIGTWITSGRRPLVADGPWVRELAARCPGSVTIVRDVRDLRSQVTAAVAVPAETWLAPEVTVGPSTAQAWRALEDILVTVHGTRAEEPGAADGASADAGGKRDEWPA